MSRELVLDNHVLSKYFFDNTVLWGVVSSLSIYDFCHVLNVSLRLNLVRRVDLDLAYYQTRNEFTSADLFSQQAPEVFVDKIYFPVYRQQLELSDADIILYTNKHNGYTLVPSQRNLDYFILVKNGLYHIHLQEIHKYLNQIRKISSCIQINLENQKWIDNLIL